ncbi:hypothetical protein D915_002083 [Fasciola hepatica]|uniref:EGF-like domain-containing protein n=1 Tax=Fasciola hepatica TaxID=6192 RepID=A0A4E0S3B2_FASHE|nr:hypothetical protein D915_002083 [Fasciola hepatica]
MEWDTRLEDSKSEYYKKMSTSVCIFLLKVTRYSGSVALRKVSCKFRGFRRGSVQTFVDAVAETTPSVAPTELQVTVSLINGIQNYVRSNESKNDTQFIFSLSNPIQVADNTPDKRCANYSSHCSPNARCEDVNGGFLCSCENFWSDTNRTLPGRECRLSDEAIALIFVAILAFTAIIIFVIIAAIYLNRFRYA